MRSSTHVCSCGLILQRDWNAAINILLKAKSTVGQT
ncbi:MULTISPECIES: zinc ribbon domain-containing protein [Aerosakkonema]